jgi:hypothetical protein
MFRYSKTTAGIVCGFRVRSTFYRKSQFIQKNIRLYGAQKFHNGVLCDFHSVHMEPTCRAISPFRFDLIVGLAFTRALI